MITIEMDNVFSTFLNLTQQLKESLYSLLSYELKTFGKTEKKYIFDKYLSQTYTGLVPRIVKFFFENDIPYVIKDKRIKPETNFEVQINSNYIMRDYQEEIVNKASSRSIIQAATGAGKTFIMFNLIKKFAVKPVVVVAPKVSLAEQIKEEFEKFSNQEIGIYTGIEKEIKDITICTPQSASEELLNNAKAIFYDEVHNLPSTTIFNTSIDSPNAYYRIGVSATPWRDGGDEILIEAALSIRKPHLSINASKLIDKGKLVPCDINFITINSEIAWQGNYHKTYELAITHNEERNDTIANIAYKASFINNRSTLILIKKIKHGEIIEKKITQKIPSLEVKTFFIDGTEIEVKEVEFLSGKDNSKRRNAVFQSVREGFTKILIGSTIADEGLDCPTLDCLILAGGGRSSTRAFQRIGRVLRLHENKTKAIVFDFIDKTKTFYNHYLYRRALYETEPRWNIKAF